jgi:hypothetical protein
MNQETTLKRLISELGAGPLEIKLGDTTFNLQDERTMILFDQVFQKYLLGPKGCLERIEKGEKIKSQLTPDQLNYLEELKRERDLINDLFSEVSKKMIDYSVMRFVCIEVQKSLDTLIIDGKVPKRLMPEQVEAIESMYAKFSGIISFINHKLQ